MSLFVPWLSTCRSRLPRLPRASELKKGLPCPPFFSPRPRSSRSRSTRRKRLSARRARRRRRGDRRVDRRRAHPCRGADPARADHAKLAAHARRLAGRTAASPVLPAPLQALTAARVYDFDGTAQDVDTQAFVPDLGASALTFAPWALPAPGRSVGRHRARRDGRLRRRRDRRAGSRCARRSACWSRIGTRTAAWWRAARAAPCCRQTVAALIAPYRVLSL